MRPAAPGAPPHHVVLVGFMGAGKTTVGRLLAARFGLPFVDADAHVEAQQGRSVQEVFAADGEEAFRDLEAAAVRELVGRPSAVVSLGGGALGRRETRAVLAGHDVVHLAVGLRSALARVGDDAGRPVLAQPGLAERHAARAAHYAEVATAVVDTDDRTPQEVADLVAAALADSRG